MLPLHATDRVTHIGVLQGSGAGLNKDRAVDNVSKARKAFYSLGSVGILKNMNPVVGYSMFCQYVEPILLYGTETWIRADAAYRVLDVFYLKSIKVLQGLPDRVATVGAISLLGALPIRAKIHLRRLSLLWNLTQDEHSVTYNIVARQYLLGNRRSWVTETAELLEKYHLPTLGELLAAPPSKLQWKHMVKETITSHWIQWVAKEIPEKSSLKYLSSDQACVAKTHPVWQTSVNDAWRSLHARTRVRLLTGTYTLQANIAKFNQNEVDPTCQLCGTLPEDRVHFIAMCTELSATRKAALQSLQHVSSDAIYQDQLKEAWKTPDNRTRLLLNPISLGVVSADGLAEGEVAEVERCVTTFCQFLHQDRWRRLQALKDGNKPTTHPD